MQKHRPKNLNLLSMRLPLPALVSVLHRASGLLLFLALPLLLTALQRSLTSAQGFAEVVASLAYPACKLLLLGLAWALTYHFCAGIRHLALDMHWGNTLSGARASATWVLLVSAGLTGLAAWWLC
jgi:succinate dehydrogenase / fumarate reductase cytochrome b subunit